MKISKQAKRQAKQLFRSCRTGAFLDERRASQIVTDLLSAKPRGYLAALGYFRRLVQLDAERRSARIESAVPLTPEVQASVKASLEKKYGPALTFEFLQNPALLGGIRVQVGSDLYDGTVRTRLEQIQQAFESA